MSKYISFSDLLARWGIRDFEVLDYLKKGLQPYSEYGQPLSCSISHHAGHHRSKELSIVRETLRNMESWSHRDQSEVEDILPVSESEVPTDDPLLKNQWIEELREQEAKVLEEWKAIEDDDPGFSSWKYFVMPELDQDVESILGELKGSNYRLKDVLEIGKKHGLEPPDQIGAEKTKSISDGKGKKKRRHCQIQKDNCRRAVPRIWDKDKTLTVPELYNHEEIIGFTYRLDGKRYKPNIFRGWVKDLNPNRNPGRRPKKKA